MSLYQYEMLEQKSHENEELLTMLISKEHQHTLVLQDLIHTKKELEELKESKDKLVQTTDIEILSLKHNVQRFQELSEHLKERNEDSKQQIEDSKKLILVLEENAKLKDDCLMLLQDFQKHAKLIIEAEIKIRCDQYAAQELEHTEYLEQHVQQLQVELQRTLLESEHQSHNLQHIQNANEQRFNQDRRPPRNPESPQKK